MPKKTKFVSTPKDSLEAKIFELVSSSPDEEWTLAVLIEHLATVQIEIGTVTAVEGVKELLALGLIDGTVEAFLYSSTSRVSTPMDDLRRENTRLEKLVRDRPTVTVEKTVEKYIGIQLLKGKKVVKKIKEVMHKEMPTILDLANERENIMLFGPTGSGKTYVSSQAARCMGLDFGMISFTSGASESKLEGSIGIVANARGGTKTDYVESDFVRIYEGGGVFLMDELDAADPNLLLLINSALANDCFPLPKRAKNPIAKRHADFVCIATANTPGTNGSRMYSGRNKLDAATLDRFQIGKVLLDYDTDIERSLCDNEELLAWCWGVRKAIEDHQLERAMSTRFIEKSHGMMKNRKWTIERIQDAYFVGWREDEVNKVKASLV